MYECLEGVVEVRHRVFVVHVVLKEGAVVRLVGQIGFICVTRRRCRYIP